jgi:hypothetical protein
MSCPNVPFLCFFVVHLSVVDAWFHGHRLFKANFWFPIAMLIVYIILFHLFVTKILLCHCVLYLTMRWKLCLYGNKLVFISILRKYFQFVYNKNQRKPPRGNENGKNFTCPSPRDNSILRKWNMAFPSCSILKKVSSMNNAPMKY